MKKEILLFDLDGTLINPEKAIFSSILYAVEKLGLERPAPETLRKFVGPPLIHSFQQFIGLDKEKSQQALLLYREYFQENGIQSNQTYPEIEEVLQYFYEKNFTMLIATSKPEIFAKQITDFLNLSHFFSGIYGASLDGKRSEKADIIRYALETQAIHDLSKCVMIGDRSHDLIGAKENKMDAIAVLWGFGDEVEFQTFEAKHIAKTPQDLISLLS